MTEIERLHNKLDGIAAGQAGLEAAMANGAARLDALSSQIAELRGSWVPRQECDARHRPLNSFVQRAADERRVKWTLYVMGLGIIMSAALGLVNLLWRG